MGQGVPSQVWCQCCLGAKEERGAGVRSPSWEARQQPARLAEADGNASDQPLGTEPLALMLLVYREVGRERGARP